MDDVVRLLQPAQDYISQIGPALFTFNNTHPIGIHLTRFAARASIFEIPPATNGQTAIAPPPASTVDSFEKVVGLKNALGLVEFCESRISTFPFWFDLDCQSARGFGMMGSAGVRTREAIIDMVLSFVEPLIDDCMRNKLDQWEPELPSQAWELKVRAARQVMMSTRTDIDVERRSKALQEYETALKHLSSVDFIAASKFAT